MPNHWYHAPPPDAGGLVEQPLPFDALESISSESTDTIHGINEPFVKLICGDTIDTLKQMDAGSVHCFCTSPPYYNLRDYGLPPRIWGRRIDCAHVWGDTIGCNHPGQVEQTKWKAADAAGSGQTATRGQFCQQCSAWSGCLGLEPSTDLFIAHLVEVFHEVKRVLRPDGNFWLNIADSYAGPGKHTEPTKYAVCDDHKPVRKRTKGLSGKSLLLVPEQLIVALRNDGWIVRQVNIWHKPNPMCSSTKDRTTSAFEYVYHLVKQDRYVYNAAAIEEPIAKSSAKRYQHVLDHNEQYDPSRHKHGVGINPSPMEVLTRGAAGIMAKGTRNKRNVWTIPTQPFRGAHFACWPEKLCEIMIKAGCPDGGIVCDPFVGSGRTGMVAHRLGRSFIGIDASASYIEMADNAIKGLPLEQKPDDKQGKTGNPTYTGFNKRWAAREQENG